MRIYCDKELIIKDAAESKYLAYSTFNHSYVLINKYTKFLIEMVRENDTINYDLIKLRFKNTFHINIEKKDIDYVIKKLKESSILFDSKETVENERRKTINTFSKNENLDLKTAYIHPTFKCNFDCSYCYNREVNKKIKELDTERWIEIIDKLETKGTKSFIFTGGEPLLRDDLGIILKNIKTKENSVTLLTNGSLLKDKFDSIIPFVDNVILSLDSLDINVNALNRSNKNYYSIIETIEMFSKIAPNKLKVRSVITLNNHKSINKFHKAIQEKYGIKTVDVLCLPTKESEIKNIPPLLNKKEANLTEAELPFKCGAGTKIIAIDPSGDIYPCQSLLLPELKITNVLKNNWYNILKNSDMLNKFNISVDDINICNDCSLRYLCGGGCPAISYKVYGKEGKHLDFLCDHLKSVAKMRLKMLASCGNKK